MEREFPTEKEQLEREIEITRAEWEKEKQYTNKRQRTRRGRTEARQRELEEYKYNFAREQQLARDQSSDEIAKAQKELAERKTELERRVGRARKGTCRERAGIGGAPRRAAGFAQELKAAAERRRPGTHGQSSSTRRPRNCSAAQLEGEKNVLATKIAALEHTVQEQAEQLARLEQQAEKAYAQVQEIAVRAIEGSASTKQLANLQQLFSDQVRKSSSPER